MLGLGKPGFDLGQRSTGDGFAGGNQFGGALEAIVAESANVGGKNDVGGSFPDAAHLLLGDGEALSDYVEDVTRSLEVDPVRAEIDAEHTIGSHLAQWNGGNRMSEHAVDEETTVDVYRQEHAGIGATGADGIDERTGLENDRVAGDEIGCCDGERNLEFFEGAYLEDLLEEPGHAVVGSDAVTGDGPAGEMLEADKGSDLGEFLGGDAAAIGGAYDRSDAGTGDEANRDSLFFEDFEDADMGESTGKTAAEGDADGRRFGLRLSKAWDSYGSADFPGKRLDTANDLQKLVHPGTPQIPDIQRITIR